MSESDYTVVDGDTLQRVAIKFNTTPGDLARVNKISPFQSVLFPGKKLKIPTDEDILKVNTNYSTSPQNKVHLRPPSNKLPGTITRISEPLPSTRGYSVDSDTDDLAEKQFVKLKSCRIIGEELTKCPGTLLITPKFLVFDSERNPSFSDSDEIIKTAEPIHNVGLYILLESVYGLNTYSSLHELVDISNDNISKALANFNDVDIDSNGCKSHLKTSNDEKLPTEISDTKNNDVTTATVPDESANETDELPKLLYLVVKAQPLSDSYSGPEIPLQSIHRQTSNQAQIFVFGVPNDKIEEAYSFLIISGVGGYCDRPSSNQAGPPSPSSSLATSQLVDHVNQTSVVADALKAFDEEVFLPQLKNGESQILSESMLLDLSKHIPSHLSGSNFYLVYQTGRHGYSLGTIYRKMANLNCPTLLLIRDVSNTVFGAYMTDAFRISTHYYGSGECFVFNWAPDFKKYEWTRENNFFLKGDPNCFSIGSKSGHSAIWFEDSLKYGCSEYTDTFDNPRLSGVCPPSSYKKSDQTLADKTNNNQSSSSPSKEVPVPASVPDTSNIIYREVSYSSTAMEYNFIIDRLEIWRFNV